MNGTDIQSKLKSIGRIVLGTLFLSFATSFFLLPFDMVIGGVSGVAILLSRLLPIHEETLIALLTWGLFFVGWRILGRIFAAGTLLSCVVYPLGTGVFSHLRRAGWLPSFPTNGGVDSMLFAALLGGALIGVGCALTFLGGGSTGGMDILAFLICRLVGNIRLSTAILLIDVAVILGGAILLKDPWRTVAGCLSAGVGALTVELFLRMARFE